MPMWLHVSMRMNSRGQSRYVGLAMIALLAFGCRSEPTDRPVTPMPRKGAIEALLPSAVSLAAANGAPTHVLVVDATCSKSMQALDRVLSDTLWIQRARIAYMPQHLRDPNAMLETMALECARRSGALHEYVLDRLARSDSVRKPLLESAVRIGIPKARFLSCLSDSAIVHQIQGQSATAGSVGIWNLPALISRDSAWIGERAVRRVYRAVGL